MNSWVNWSGRQHCEPQQLLFTKSPEDIAAIVASASPAGRCVRVAGAGHSHYGLVPTNDVLLDLSGLSGLIDVATDLSTAMVWAGTPISMLGRPFHTAGVALANQGDIDRQAIGGAVATGTHGTGRTLRNLSAAVRALTLVTTGGEIIRCSAVERPEIFGAARLGLGAFGVVTELELAVVPAYRLREAGWRTPYEELRPDIAEHAAAHRHFEFFWYPPRDLAIVKAIDETDDPPEYPLAAEGARVGWNYEVLPNHRPRLHTEMEFAVPVERSLECLDEVRELIMRKWPDLEWPVEYRTLAADDVWLSQAYERDVATISVHQGIDVSDEPLFNACEEIFHRYDGRPHWGKMHSFTPDELAEAHPRWTDWWAARDAVDPAGVFLNDRLASWRPS